MTMRKFIFVYILMLAGCNTREPLRFSMDTIEINGQQYWIEQLDDGGYWINSNHGYVINIFDMDNDGILRYAPHNTDKFWYFLGPDIFAVVYKEDESVMEARNTLGLSKIDGVYHLTAPGMNPTR